MQMKRRDNATQKDLPIEGVFSISSGEASLWGSKEEVDAAAATAEGLKKDEDDVRSNCLD